MAPQTSAHAPGPEGGMPCGGPEGCRGIRSRSWGFLPAGFTAALLLSGGRFPGLQCPIHALTGIPCPTCYLTRATAAALRGQLPESMELHLFGPAAAALLVIWSLQAIRRRRLVPPPIQGPWLVLAGLGLFLHWCLRLIAPDGFGLCACPLPGG